LQVKKRNGDIQEFDIIKIAKAIYKARIDAVKDKTLEDCVTEAQEVMKTIPQEEVVEIEVIQDGIEAYLMKKNELEVFKNFTFYREKRRQDRLNPWSNNDERQDLILQKYTKKGENKKEFIDRISIGNPQLAKIFRNREAI
jgi:ribonucleoside-diphosphate reductase alpha chain